MKIGVFDTGKGGEIVAEKLQSLFPGNEFIIVNDRAHLPYGNKTAEEIIELTDATIQPLLVSCEIIIIACNTATALAIETLRAKYPTKKFIGFEPAIKPAASHSKKKKIMVLATPATLQSPRYLALKERCVSDVTVIEPNCSSWAQKIEADEFSDEELRPVIELAIIENADELVLGCTHYLSLEEKLQKALPSVKIQNPVGGVARRLKEIMLK